jgi:hypothetical protein
VTRDEAIAIITACLISVLHPDHFSENHSSEHCYHMEYIRDFLEGHRYLLNDL